MTTTTNNGPRPGLTVERCWQCGDTGRIVFPDGSVETCGCVHASPASRNLASNVGRTLNGLGNPIDSEDY
jgi:hypothetical protein